MTVHDAMASASIAGLPQEATERILALLVEHPSIQNCWGTSTGRGSPCIRSRAYRLSRRSPQQMHGFAGFAQQASCFAVEGG